MGTIVSANFQIKTKQNTIGKRLEKNILKKPRATITIANCIVNLFSSDREGEKNERPYGNCTKDV